MAEQAATAASTFCWNELMTPDPEAAKRFYTQLLGWTSRESDIGEAGTYTIFAAGDKDVGGMMKTTKGEIPPHWLSYVAVEDVDAATKKAEQLGAKPCVPPTDIPNVGRFSVITDPTGATIGLYQSK